MFEVEQKFRVDDIDQLATRLGDLNANEDSCQLHLDTYFNHPCRDFVVTREALRVRRVDGMPLVTYKGSHLPGAIKARQELEWRLDPGDADGTKTETLLELLGFRKVATVEKRRRTFTLPEPFADFCVVIDQVVSLGDFAEVELIVEESAEIELARTRIGRLAEQLNLSLGESRSYLTLLLQSRHPPG